MARKKQTQDLPQPPAINEEALEQNRQITAEETQRLMEIDSTYGDGLPYDCTRIIHETRFYLNQSAEAMLEAGKRLILLKEHERHGDFIKALDQIGIAPRGAQKMMQAAVKFSGAKAPLVAHLGATKMLDLLTEDDEDLEALAEGGTLAGHTLDEVERMSVSELRKALRKEREKRQHDQETHEQLLASKNRKVDELDRKLRESKKRTRPWPERCNDINLEVTGAAAQALEAGDQLDVLRDVILQEDFGDDGEAALEMMAVVYYDAINQLTGKVAELMDACEDVFGGYKHKARPALRVMEETGS